MLSSADEVDQPYLRAVVEGPGDEAVVCSLASETGFNVGDVIVKGGKRNLDPRLHAYAAAARHAPWLVLRDLDHDAECAPDLVEQLLPRRPPNLLLRVPVRSLEAWLLADREAIAHFLSVPVTLVPHAPEVLDRPKRALVDLARRSRSAAIRREMVPNEGISADVGPGYIARLIEFVESTWSPTRAAPRSPSLAGCLEGLRVLRSRVADR